MSSAAKAAEPFRFFTRHNLMELTGLRASNLWQLLHFLKESPASCIYHHTHRFLHQRQHISPDPPNDFAYWVSNSLGEKKLGEQLASIDIARFGDLESLRGALVEIVDRHIKKNFFASFRKIELGEALFFIKSISYILPTPYLVTDLKEFAAALQAVTTDSIYFHTFEARMRLKHETNDFSSWIQGSLGDERLAGEISRLDPYTYTVEELRAAIISLVQRRIGG